MKAIYLIHQGLPKTLILFILKNGRTAVLWLFSRSRFLSGRRGSLHLARAPVSAAGSHRDGTRVSTDGRGGEEGEEEWAGLKHGREE